MPKHLIVYSHGFGTRRDDNGLFPDIAAAFPGAESSLFDYYEIDEEKQTVRICPFSVQVAKLRQVVAELREKNPEAIVDLIGHSQGTVIPALAGLEGIRKMVFLAPVFDLDISRSISRYQEKPGAIIDLEGLSFVPSSSGLSKVIPKEYWQEREGVDLLAAYSSLAEKTEITAIIANQDELLPPSDLSGLSSKVTVLALEGDHNFSSPQRLGMIEAIKEILS